VRTDKLRKEFDLDIRWRVFPLHPETPEEGQTLADLFAGSYDIEAMMQRCKEVAAELDLPFGERTHTYNSRRAQELGKWAEEQGAGEAFHRAVYRAYYVDGCNIAMPDKLAEIAESVGLDPDTALLTLDKKSYAAHVDDDWRRAQEFGVTAIPTVIYRQHALVGFQPYAHYRRLIDSASTP
jgi:predicted DsbA family dithiol-disulfide isomerase